jgi:hypothetical protein
MAPDEGNMYLLGKIGSAEQKARFLARWFPANRDRRSS